MAKKFWAAPAIILALVMLTTGGCVPTAKLGKKDSDLDKIRSGMAEGDLVETAGIADFIDLSDYRFSIYYYKEKLLSDCEKQPQECFPVAVQHGRVAAVGREQTNAWKKRFAAVSQKQTEARKDGVQEETRKDSAQEETREAEIARLDRQVRKIPMAKTMENLTIYRRLLKLDPDNKRYRRKVAFYQKRFEKEKSRKDALRKAQNRALERLEGNEKVLMALKILGAGKFHVWIKNVGKSAFVVDSDQFSLLCRDGKRFGPYRSKDFGIELAPGQQVDGRISFETYCSPRELTFISPVAGRVFRAVPQTDP